MKNLEMEVNKMSRKLNTVNTQLEKLKEYDSDLSDSEDEDEASHFNIADIDFGKSGF